MKILLANPPWYDEGRSELWGVRAGSRWPHFQVLSKPNSLPRYLPFPFFLAISAHLLRNAGHQVLLLDGVAEGVSTERFYEKVEQFSPELIFVETSTPSFDYDIEIMRTLRKAMPKVKIVAGGAHARDFALSTMKCQKCFDYWIAGEYEESLLKLADAIENDSTFNEIPGLNGQTIKTTKFARVDDLNLLPQPLYSSLPMGNYSDPVCGLPAPQAQTWLSRGCPFKCSFCVWPQIIYGERKYRTRNIDLALDEIEFLIEKYGCESFYFDDDTTNIGEKRMAELARKITDRGLNKFPWSMMARADCMSDEMIANLAAAGLYSIKYGVESISPRLIDACDKKTDLPKTLRIIEKTKNLGVKTHLTFTFGLPGETEATMRQTAKFALETAPESVQFSLCAPFPGTTFYQDCVKNKWLKSEDWGSFLGSGEETVISTPELPAEKLSSVFKEITREWSDFVAQRVEERGEILLNELRALVADGKKWSFTGDRDFVPFLWEDPVIRAAAIEGDSLGSQDRVLVIASRHEEEKIYRQIVRKSENPIPKDRILRLFK